MKRNRRNDCLFFKTRDWQTNRTKVSEMNVMNFLPC